MAIKQSPWALFKKTAASVLTSGSVVKQEFYYDASNGLLATDIVDFGVLPANAKIVDATLFADASIGAANANIGIMSGDIGSTDATRTVGSEIFSAQSLATAHTTLVKLSSVTALNLAPGATDRSIGLQVSANVVAGANKIIRLIVHYSM